MRVAGERGAVRGGQVKQLPLIQLKYANLLI